MYTFKLVNENQDEVWLLDGSRRFFVILNGQSLLLDKGEMVFSEMYKGIWKN